MGLNLGSALDSLIKEIKDTESKTSTEVEELKTDIKEEEDEVSHLEKARGAIEKLETEGIQNAYTSDDLQVLLDKAEEHLEKAREEEVDAIERERAQLEQGQQKEQEIEDLETKIEELENELREEGHI